MSYKAKKEESPYDLMKSHLPQLREWLYSFREYVNRELFIQEYGEELELHNQKPDVQSIVEALYYIEKLQIEVNALQIPAILQKKSVTRKISDDFYNNKYTTDENESKDI